MELPEDIIDNHMPLNKLITRYRTDLKLANYPKDQELLNNETKRKNFRKASVLYYLELLKDIQPDIR
jgi:hypothetical protein